MGQGWKEAQQSQGQQSNNKGEGQRDKRGEARRTESHGKYNGGSNDNVDANHMMTLSNPASIRVLKERHDINKRWAKFSYGYFTVCKDTLAHWQTRLGLTHRRMDLYSS